MKKHKAVKILANLLADVAAVEVELGCPTGASIQALEVANGVVTLLNMDDISEMLVSQILDSKQALREQGVKIA